MSCNPGRTRQTQPVSMSEYQRISVVDIVVTQLDPAKCTLNISNCRILCNTAEKKKSGRRVRETMIQAKMQDFLKGISHNNKNMQTVWKSFV